LALAGTKNGGTVVGGNTTTRVAGTGRWTIQQSSQSTIIKMATFNLGVGETTTFNQPTVRGAANRVIGGLGPTILNVDAARQRHRSSLSKRRRHPDGSQCESSTPPASLATTNDISTEDFMAGKIISTFRACPNASVVNLGTITAMSGVAELVALRRCAQLWHLSRATLGTSAWRRQRITLDFYGAISPKPWIPCVPRRFFRPLAGIRRLFRGCGRLTQRFAYAAE